MIILVQYIELQLYANAVKTNITMLSHAKITALIKLRQHQRQHEIVSNLARRTNCIVSNLRTNTFPVRRRIRVNRISSRLLHSNKI